MGGKIISARLNEETAWELEYLKSSLGKKRATQVLVTAIHHLYRIQSQKNQKMSPYDFLKETGFIGGTVGEETASVDYKKHVTDRIMNKQ